MAADFFVSYNRADAEWAQWIGWQLEAAGHVTILQAWDFRPGSNFVLEMNRATAQATRTIAVLSPDYLGSRFTAPEWAAAFAQDPTGERGLLIPVRIASCDVEGLLPQIVYIDLVGLDEVTARDRLLAGISGERTKPKTSPRFPGAGTQGGPAPPSMAAEAPEGHRLGAAEALARIENERWGAPPRQAVGYGNAWLGIAVIPERQDAPFVDVLRFGDPDFRAELVTRGMSGAPGILRTDWATTHQERQESLALIQTGPDRRTSFRGIELFADGTILYTGEVERRRQRSSISLADGYIIDEREVRTTAMALVGFVSGYYRAINADTGDLYVGASLSGIEHKFLGIPPDFELTSMTIPDHGLEDPLRIPSAPLKLTRTDLRDAAAFADTLVRHAVRLFRMKNSYYPPDR